MCSPSVQLSQLPGESFAEDRQGGDDKHGKFDEDDDVAEQVGAPLNKNKETKKQRKEDSW